VNNTYAATADTARLRQSGSVVDSGPFDPCLFVVATLLGTGLVLTPQPLIAPMPVTEVIEVDRSVFDGGGAMPVLHWTVKNEKHAQPRANGSARFGAAGAPMIHNNCFLAAENL
jgi:hypothetical protein